MKNKKFYVLRIILIAIVSFLFGVIFEYGLLDVDKYYTTKPLIGSYATNAEGPGSKYIVFLEDESVALYNQTGLYMEGSIVKLKENIYKFVFENTETYAIYYEDEIILIHDDSVETYKKFSNLVYLIGIE